jgi:hypothetical protein
MDQLCQFLAHTLCFHALKFENVHTRKVDLGKYLEYSVYNISWQLASLQILKEINCMV